MINISAFKHVEIKALNVIFLLLAIPYSLSASICIDYLNLGQDSINVLALTTPDILFARPKLNPLLLSNELSLKPRFDPLSPRYDLSQTWHLSNLLGEYELIINPIPIGLQFVIIPRRNESSNSLKKILQILLENFFEAASVSYPVRPDRVVSEHLAVNLTLRPWTTSEISQLLEQIKMNLDKMPSRQMTTSDLVLSNENHMTDLIEFGQLHFPEIESSEFVSLAANYIPFFIEAQSSLENLVFNEDVFSVRPLKPDPIQERTLSVLFQTQLNIIEMRRNLRSRFIEALRTEINQTKFYKFY